MFSVLLICLILNVSLVNAQVGGACPAPPPSVCAETNSFCETDYAGNDICCDSLLNLNPCYESGNPAKGCATCADGSTGDCVSGCTDKNCIGFDSSNCMGDITCTDRIKGWNVNVCEKYTEDAPVRCLENTIGCTSTTAYEYCEYKSAGPLVATGVSAAATCLAAGCARADRCTPGDLESSHNSVALVCYTDKAQHGCSTGQVCDGGSDCVIPTALGGACYGATYDAPCAGVDSCQDSFAGATQKFCCSSTSDCWANGDASKGCATCSGDGTCVSGCSNKQCIGLDSNCAATPIACTDRIKGWTGAACMKWTESAPGRCLENTVGCTSANSYEYCNIKSVTPSPTPTATSAAATCGSSQCANPAACVPFAAATTGDTINEICFTDNAQHGCTSGQVCDGSGTCVLPTAPGQSCYTAQFDRPCDGAQSCQADYLGATSKYCCAANTDCHNTADQSTGCGTCNSFDGTCVSACTDFNCVALDAATCTTPVPCQTRVRGWDGADGRKCMRFAEDADARCRKDVVGCADINSAADHCLLKDGSTATTLTEVRACGSLECRKASACQLGELVSANDDFSEICHVDFGQHGCNSGEVCDSTGTCQPVSALGAACPGGLCVSPNSCQTSYDGTNDYCCDSATACTGGCATCSGTGACVSDCNSFTCFQDSSCSSPILCDNIIAGWDLTNAEKCMRFDQNADGRCKKDTVGCAASNDYDHCDIQTGSTPNPLVEVQSCVSAGCQRIGACQRGQSVTDNDELAEICYVNYEAGNCPPDQVCDPTGACVPIVALGSSCTGGGTPCAPPISCQESADTTNYCCASGTMCYANNAATACATCAGAGGTCKSSCTDPNGCVGADPNCSGTIPCLDLVKGWNANSCEIFNENADARCRNGALGCVSGAEVKDYCDLKDGVMPTAVRTPASCPSSGCRRDTKCQRGDAASDNDEFLEICFNDYKRNGCSVTQACNANGACTTIEALGAECTGTPRKPCASVDSCQAAPWDSSKLYCCSSTSSCHDGTTARGCSTCKGDGSCVNGCTNSAGCVGADSVCVAQIACTNIIKGWNGASCERYTEPADARCMPASMSPGGGCATSTTYALCALKNGATPTNTAAASCGSAACKRPNVCTPNQNSAPWDTVTEVCFTDNAQHGCSAPLVCDATGTCSARPLGQTCSAGTDCLSGNCVNNVCCNVASCGTCNTCQAPSGTCAPWCANPAGCDEPACTDVACNNKALGWMGAACEFYSGADEGRCKTDGTCGASNDLTLCGSDRWTPTTTAAKTCGATDCLAANVCNAGDDTSAYSQSNICLSGGEACSGGTCSTGGVCLKSNGQTCTQDSECSSNLCRNGPGAQKYCCSSDCHRGCGNCQSGTCVACSGGGCNASMCPTDTDIFCQDKLAGFVGLECRVYTEDQTNVQACGLTGLCAANNDYHLCTSAASTLAHVSPAAPCGETACRNVGNCVKGTSQTTIPFNVACDESGAVNGCTGGDVCRTGATCQEPLRDNGDTCTTGTQCSSGICAVDGVCCAVPCTGCGQCASSSGTSCNPVCSTPGGCVAPAAAGCSPIACTNINKGFTAGNACEYFTGPTASGVCPNGQTTCASTTNYQFCAAPVSAPTATSAFSCGSSSCRDVGECVANTPYTYSTFQDICIADDSTVCQADRVCSSASGTCVLTNGKTCTGMTSQCLSGNCVETASGAFTCCSSAAGGCGDCSSGTYTPCATGPANGCAPPFGAGCSMIPCAGKIAGWSSNTCERFVANTAAKCGSTNACVTDPSLGYCTGSREASGAATCVSSLCRKACPRGAVSGDYDSVAEVCHTDNTQSCGTGLVCTTGGSCRKVNGQTCSVQSSSSTECVSPFCGGVGPHCCAVDCAPGCFSCASGTTCSPTCSSPAGCAATGGACSAAITCTNTIKGWSGNSCQVYNANAAGRCKNGGGCTSGSDVSYCDTPGGGTPGVNEVTCGSDQCRDLSTCMTGTAKPSTFNVAAVCITSGPGRCGANLECDSTGTCKKSFGVSCTGGGECASGLCHRGKCCASACGACEVCDSSGACVAECSDPDGCLPTVGTDCPTQIGCSAVVSGWGAASGGTVTCQKYASNAAGMCLPTRLSGASDLCTRADSYQFCPVHKTTVPVENACQSAGVCGTCDVGCKPPGAPYCQPLAIAANNDRPNEACFTTGSQSCSGANEECTFEGKCATPGGVCTGNAQCVMGQTCEGFSSPKFCCETTPCAHSCQTCNGGTCAPRCSSNSGCADTFCAPTQISCNNRVKGWSGPDCQKFTANEAGLCQNGGLCSTSTSYSYCAGAGETVVSCIDAECRNPSLCMKGAALPSTAADVCYTDGSNDGQCQPGFACGAGGACLKKAAETCAQGSECLSGFCSQGVCCDRQCGGAFGGPMFENDCYSCALAATRGVCTARTGLSCGSSALPTDCDALVSGWSGLTCRKYTADTTGVCTSAGVCDTPSTLCETNNAPDASHVVCLDARCQDTTKCQRYDVASMSLIDDVCKTDVDEATCDAIKCDEYAKGWNGATCEKYSSGPATGHCLGDSSCAAADTKASFDAFCGTTAASAYACGSSECIVTSKCQEASELAGESVTDGCQNDVDQALCPDIDCSTTVAGWGGGANSRFCQRYVEPHLGRCETGGTCAVATTLCNAASPQSTTNIPTGACPTAFCRDLTKCNRFETVSANDARAKICLIDAPSDPCPDLTCSNRVSGLNGNTCQRFVSNSTGHCTAASECITGCNQVPLQTTTAISTCGSIECVRPGACPANALASAWDDVSELCYVNEENGACRTPSGELGPLCDATGTCRTKDTGGDCLIDDNCTQKNCWKPPGSSASTQGICCTAPCKNDCEYCDASGVCRSRTDQPCGLPPGDPTGPTPLVCPLYVKGWGSSGNAARQCFKYGQNRDAQCNDASQCRYDAALCEAVPSVTLSTPHLLPCTASACKKTCDPFASVDTVSQSTVCHTNVPIAGCTDITCPTVHAGWRSASSPVCERWGIVHDGFCESGSGFSGRCSTSVTHCKDQPSQTRVQHAACGARECRKDSACAVGTPIVNGAAAALADVCDLSVVDLDCANIPCTSVTSGWNGRRCQRYQADHPGYCTSTGSCDGNVDRCENDTGLQSPLQLTTTFACDHVACTNATTCQALQPRPTSKAQVCRMDVLEPNCPDIDCSGTVRGWNGKVCQRYSEDFRGWCTITSDCDTNVARCDTPAAVTQGISGVRIAECGSLECIDPTKCQKLTKNANSDSEAEVCLQSQNVAGCGAPHTFPCNEFVTGWGTGQNRATCEKYAVTSAGYCNANSTCIRDCADIPSQNKVGHLVCASFGCVNQNSCTPGTRSSAYTTPADVCFTSGQHACQPGATCDATGSCVFADDGKPCNEDIECFSKNCWRPKGQTGGVGVCCNQRCDNECQECNSSPGQCKATTGDTCSLTVPCSTVLKGFSTAAPNKCQRFKDNINGTCTATGVCGTDIPTLCAGKTGIDIPQYSCGSAQCTKACAPFASTSTANSLSKVCFVNDVEQDCTDIDCPSFLAGYSSTDPLQCLKYGAPHPGYCDDRAACSQDVQYCNDAAVVGTVPHIKCGAVECVNPDGCKPGARLRSFSSLADVCVVNKPVAACPEVECKTRIKGWFGRTCQKYALNKPGFCNTKAECETAVSACSGLLGTTHIRCGSDKCRRSCEAGDNADLLTYDKTCLTNQAVEACEDIRCTLFVKGWSGTKCERYASDNSGYCDEFSRCSTSVEFCSGAGEPIPGAECGSVVCQRKDGCFPGAPVSPFAETIAHVCDLNVENDECPALECTKQLAGWNGNVCERYTRNTAGFCDGTGTCLDECPLIPSQGRTAAARCGSAACVKKDACVAGDALIAANSANDICFTDGAQHDCPAGSTCDADGACSFTGSGGKLADNFLCSAPSECASGFCVTSDEGMNICCNAACTGECVECVSGKCQPKVGQLCGDGQCKVCDARGDCKPRTTLCGETAIDGSPLFGCNAAPTNATQGTQCVRGVCQDCTTVSPPPVSKPPPTPPPGPPDDCIDNVDCGGFTPEQISAAEAMNKTLSGAGTCLAGKCVCSDGYKGQFCEEFFCDPKYNCNAAGSGGTCTGANECTCNQGFLPPNCEASCNGTVTVDMVDTPVNSCGPAGGGARTGWCTAPNKCKCDPGFKGVDCQTNAGVAKPCGGTNDPCDEGLTCYEDASLGDGTGICCATSCTGECNTCLGVNGGGMDDATRGFCKPKIGGRCGNSTDACQVCALDSSSGLGVCGQHSSLCVAQGGEPGDAFGCSVDEFCYEGSCNACAATAMCSSGGEFTLDLTSINVKLPFGVCANEAGPATVITFTAPSGCLVAWRPGSGAGVDCQATDNKITAGGSEELTINFAPPLDRNLLLTFGVVSGRDKGQLFVTHRAPDMAVAPPRRKRAALQTSTAPAATSTTGASSSTSTAAVGASSTTAAASSSTTSTAMATPAPTEDPGQTVETKVEFDSAEVELLELEAIRSIRIVAIDGAFDVTQIKSTGFVAAATPTTTLASTTAEPSTSQTTETASETSTTLPEVKETEAPSAGFFDNIGAGLRGENPTYLGIFIGAIVFILVAVIGCIVVGVYMVKKRRAQQKLFDAYGEGKPMQSFETVTTKPSTALGDDSDDEFGIISAPTPISSSTPMGGDSGEPGTLDSFGTGTVPRVGITVEPLSSDDSSDDF